MPLRRALSSPRRFASRPNSVGALPTTIRRTRLFSRLVDGVCDPTPAKVFDGPGRGMDLLRQLWCPRGISMALSGLWPVRPWQRFLVRRLLASAWSRLRRQRSNAGPADPAYVEHFHFFGRSSGRNRRPRGYLIRRIRPSENGRSARDLRPSVIADV